MRFLLTAIFFLVGISNGAASSVPVTHATAITAAAAPTQPTSISVATPAQSDCKSLGIAYFCELLDAGSSGVASRMISPKKVRDQGDMGFFYQPLSPDRTYGLFAFGAFFHLADAHQIEIGLGGDFFSVYNGFQYRYFFRPDRFFSPVVGVGLSQERCCGETELVTNLATGSLGLNLNLGPGPIQLSKMWPVDVNPGLIGELILAPGFCEIGGDRSKTGWPIQYGYCGIGLWQIKMGAKF